MARIDIPDGDGEERQRMWQLRPQLGEAIERYNWIVQETTILSVREHEAARIRIAHLGGCLSCSGARSTNMEEFGIDESFYEDVDDPARRGRYSNREALAIEFAERFFAGKGAFDDLFWHQMRLAFSSRRSWT